MNEAKCSCAKFARLEGASVQAYAAAFLDEVKDANSGGGKLLRCRVCGRLWERRAPEVKSAGTRASLVRLDDEAGAS
jgi:rubrerythrin